MEKNSQNQQEINDIIHQNNHSGETPNKLNESQTLVENFTSEVHNITSGAVTPESIAALKSKRMLTRIDKMPKKNWPEFIANKILKIYPDQDKYTVAAGISPSGNVHAGNFRDVITAFAVQNALKDKGKNTQFLFSWDNYDRLRKVPKGIDPTFQCYIGMPLTEIPDPTTTDTSSSHFGKPVSQWPKDEAPKTWARHFEEEFETSMKELEIDMVFRDQSVEYQAGSYDDEIVSALQNRNNIAKTLLYQMSKKSIIKKINLAKGYAGEALEKEFVSEEEIQSWCDKYISTYYPISIYSEFTGKDNVEILNYDGASTLTYRCLDTNQESTINIRENRRAKLSWKIDWPMRWQYENVVCEPGGQDHGSHNGSYDTSSLISRSVMNVEPPVFVQYQFIGFAGRGKMSSSSGDVITPRRLLEIYPPDMLKWLFLKPEPSAKFDIALGGDQIIRAYSEYDKMMGKHDEIPFREAIQIGQLTGWDPNATEFILDKMGLAGKYSKHSIETRLCYARAALETYDQDSIVEVLSEKNTTYYQELQPVEKAQIHKLKEALESYDFNTGTIPELETLLYAIPKQDLGEDTALLTTLNPKDPANLDKADAIREARKLASPLQKTFFKNIYKLLLNKEEGPRLPTFAWIKRDDFLRLLDF